jgi:hypothetical protein
VGQSLRHRHTFLGHLAPTREVEWVVYAKRPFAGPEQVLDYVGLYRGEDTKRNLKHVGYLFSLVEARRKLLT